MYRLDHIADSLHLPDSDRLAPERWSDSMASLQDWYRIYGDPRSLQGWADYLGLTDAVRERLTVALTRIAALPDTRALLWHAMRVMRLHRRGITGWPRLDAALGRDAGLFYLLALLPLAEDAHRVHQERGIPPAIVRATMADFMTHVNRYELERGDPGLHPSQAGGWLRTHLMGRLYRIGRFQVVAKPFHDLAVVLRHRRSGDYLAVATRATLYDADGLPDGAGGRPTVPGTALQRPVWDSAADHLRAQPVDPDTGRLRTAPLDLARRDWVQWLADPGLVLDLHIPEGSPLDLDACRSSYTAILDFWRHYFPDEQPLAFYCESWMLDPQLADYLPPTANIIRFQREFYRLPVLSDAWGAFRHVFHLDIPYGQVGGVALQRLPRATTLQRALVDHVQAGKHWIKFGGFLPIPPDSWGRTPKPWFRPPANSE